VEGNAPEWAPKLFPPKGDLNCGAAGKTGSHGARKDHVSALRGMVIRDCLNWGQFMERQRGEKGFRGEKKVTFCKRDYYDERTQAGFLLYFLILSRKKKKKKS